MYINDMIDYVYLKVQLILVVDKIRNSKMSKPTYNYLITYNKYKKNYWNPIK